MSRRWFPRDSELTIIAGNSTAWTADDDDGLNGEIIDLGSGRFDAILVMDVTAIKISANDELYNFIVQGSNSATFASGIEELGRRLLGPTEVRKGAGDSTIGRYEIAFSNDVDGTEYRYLRVLLDVGGTSPSVTVSNMWVTKSADALG